MKFSAKTLDILKNLSALNMGLVIDSENKNIYSKKTTREVLVEWKPIEEFPFKFAIADLSDFLSTYSMFKESDLRFAEDYMTITFGNSSIKYGYSSEMVVDTPDPDDIVAVKELSEDLQLGFVIQADTLMNLHKASGVMKLNTINFKTIDGELVVKVTDSTNVTTNAYTVNLGASDGDFDFTMPTERLKSVINASYDVYVDDMLIKMYNESLQLTYWLSLD